MFENSNVEHSTVPEKSLAYSVKVTSNSGALKCSVFVNILKWPSTEPVVFQLPPYYSDNPRMPVPGIVASQLRAMDAQGQSATVTQAVPPFNQGGGEWITVPSSVKNLSYEIDLDPKDSANFGPPMPKMKSGVQMLDGSTLFLLPVMGNSLSHHWRNPIAITLNRHIAKGLTLMGDSVLNLNSNYQLMFYRGVLNPARSLDVTVGTHRITLYTTEAADSMDLYALGENMKQWIPLLENRLLPLPWQHLWIGTNTVHAGIEGIAGYWFHPQYATHAMVHLHELTHSFVGVLQGDFDDPWFKEGVTNYIGEILAVQDGYYSDSLVEKNLTNPFDSIPTVKQYALADPTLRDLFYFPLDSNYSWTAPVDYTTLLYSKGAEAAMQIDAWLLKNSGGRHDLFEVIRELSKTGNAGFTRQQFVEVLQNLAGQRADTLLQTLCDKPGPYMVSRLQESFNTLKTFDRFHPSPYRVVTAKQSVSTKRNSAVPQGKL